MIKKFIQKRYPLILIFCFAFFVRLFFLDHSFWLDESFTAVLITQPPTTIIEYTAKDVHPPLYYLCLQQWNRLGNFIFKSTDKKQFTITSMTLKKQGEIPTFDVVLSTGKTEAPLAGIDHYTWHEYHISPLKFLRLFNVLIGMINIFLLYKICTYLLPSTEEQKQIYTTLLLFAFFPLAIFWDTLIRNYSMLNLFYLSSIISLFRYLKGDSYWAFILFGTTLAGLMTNLLSLFSLPALICLSVVIQTKTKKQVIIANVIFLCAFITFIALWGNQLLFQKSLVTVEANPSLTQLISNFKHAGFQIIYSFWNNIHLPFSWLDLRQLIHKLGFYYSLFTIFLIFSVIALLNFSNQLNRPKIIILIITFFPIAIPLFINALKPGSIPDESRYYFMTIPGFCILLSYALQPKLTHSNEMKKIN